METISIIFTLLTAVLHGYFLVLEMFFWTKPYGRKVFRISSEVAQASKLLAANQGVYNGMLAVGLLATFFIPDQTPAMAIRFYCLLFVIVVGSYGWYSLKNYRVFLVQALPALVALIAML